MTESQVQRVALARLNTVPGGLFWRQNTGVARPRAGGRPVAFGRPGQADITGLVKGRRVEVECKSSTGKLSDAQIAFRDDIEAAGGLYFVISSMEQLGATVRSLSEL